MILNKWFCLCWQVWFKNKRAKCRQQNKKQPGVTKPAPVKTKTPSPPPQDQIKPAVNHNIQKPAPQLSKFEFYSWPQQTTNPLEQDIQALVNIQRQASYQPSRAVYNNMGSTPASLPPQFHPMAPEFPFAKNNAMSGWFPINHNVQSRYFTPSMV